MDDRHSAIFARNGAAMEGSIAANLAAVRERIDAAARAGGGAPESVTLVAVSKTHPAQAVREALLAGHRIFGENRVQEAEAKYPALREEFPGLALHLIGPLTDQQGARRGGFVRRDRERRPASAGAGPRQGNGA